MVENKDLKKMLNFPSSIIFASFIIIIVTTKIIDANGLSALISGYSGLLFGLIFTVGLCLLYDPTISIRQIIPIITTLIIISLLIYYLSVNFDKISSGEVSSYYDNYLVLSTIFLAIQITIITNSIYNKTQDMNTTLFSNTNYSLLVLFSLINSLIVITIGVILRFYSTQG